MGRFENSRSASVDTQFSPSGTSGPVSSFSQSLARAEGRPCVWLFARRGRRRGAAARPPPARRSRVDPVRKWTGHGEPTSSPVASPPAINSGRLTLMHWSRIPAAGHPSPPRGAYLEG